MLEEEIKLIETLTNYVILIGVVSNDTNRKSTIASVGITNAELMFIHENGSPLRNIPARPVLEKTIKWAELKFLDVINICIEGIFNGWQKNEIEKELNKLCMRMEKYARRLIYDNDGRLASNAPSTIKKKGFNHPLFVTGQLARSITCTLSTKLNLE